MSSPSRNDYDPKAYNPRLSWHFFTPKYWGTWLLLLVWIPFSLLPHRFRYWLSVKIANRMIKKQKGTMLNARANLKACFPEKSEQERETILHHTLVTSGVFLTGFGLLTLRNRHWLQNQCDIRGIEHVTQLQEQGRNIILLVPHSWTIDIPAILLASMDLPVAAMAKKQKNEVLDWLMHRQRVQYGGKVHERSDGVKPFIKSVRDGYLGYYLPDQDHGAEASVFVDFFATTKATLKGLGKLTKVSRAAIVPVFAMIDAKTGRYTVDIYPAFENFPHETEEEDAREMNQFIERAVSTNPEQYMWTLRLLKTQPDGDNVYKQAKRQLAEKQQSGK
ncbi:lauroyl-Kdo(2)-lipid IV(A) myristoyltransferase [Vibrio sp. CAIM 722]|uniref:Lipid A biosynthesis acyltransferase n=1 Tax=Vibrio eleionomae TaxID=2653505 RepID=A0A7X4LQH5_9VIBR|nr:lauroyl-Kdo(2)-lipid IV(A) myristoyltransferase [Vibrio eleionomae]MZI96050.1 lauroyl-Kdo(2)-lipid IV(A) myristoyltransferase [Vibrio eleionomae]